MNPALQRPNIDYDFLVKKSCLQLVFTYKSSEDLSSTHHSSK